MWCRPIPALVVVVAMANFLAIDSQAQQMTLFVDRVVEDRPDALIDVVDFGVSVTRDISGGVGAPARGTSELSPFVVLAEPSPASPLMFLHALEGNVIREVRLDISESFGQNELALADWTLENALVIEFATTFEDDELGELRGVDTYGFAYERIRYRYMDRDVDGTLQGIVEVEWDASRNEASVATSGAASGFAFVTGNPDLVPPAVDGPGVFVDEADRSGDYNANGLVEQGDLDLVLLNWGAELPEPEGIGWTNDLPDGVVDQQELDKVLLNWGNGVDGLGAAATIPEPSTATLAGLAALVLLYRRTHGPARSRRA